MARNITLATFKAWIRKNPNFLIMRESGFDPMVDGISYDSSAEFKPALAAAFPCDNNLGFCGIWLVGGSRNTFTEYRKNGFVGIEVYNCCGSFTVAVKEQSMNTAKLAYMIERQRGIISGLESSIAFLKTAANNEMQYTLVSEISPHYALAISRLETALKLAHAKIDILNRSLEKQNQSTTESI
jgi:hypothetical protein